MGFRLGASCLAVYVDTGFLVNHIEQLSGQLTTCRRHSSSSAAQVLLLAYHSRSLPLLRQREHLCVA